MNYFFGTTYHRSHGIEVTVKPEGKGWRATSLQNGIPVEMWGMNDSSQIAILEASCVNADSDHIHAMQDSIQQRIAGEGCVLPFPKPFANIKTVFGNQILEA